MTEFIQGVRIPDVCLPASYDAAGSQKNQLLASQYGISNSKENYFYTIGFIEFINKGR
jgi:hypothetical protein